MFSSLEFWLLREEVEQHLSARRFELFKLPVVCNFEARRRAQHAKLALLMLLQRSGIGFMKWCHVLLKFHWPSHGGRLPQPLALKTFLTHEGKLGDSVAPHQVNQVLILQQGTLTAASDHTA